MSKPKMESLAARSLAGEPELCETRDDGQVVNAGGLHLRPAYTLRGKVVLSGGKPIPPDMRVSLSTATADRQMLFAPDGSFEFKGLAKGVYIVQPAVRGYRTPPDAAGEFLVEGDRTAS
jgi:hypothetical protein